MSRYSREDLFNNSIKHYDVGIIGIFAGPNYGSIVTYYALSIILEKIGLSVLMIDRPRNNSLTTENFENHGFSFARNHYDYFVPQTQEDLLLLNDICDAFLLGSDQTWNYYVSQFWGNMFYLDFVNYPNRKIAYAASFGHDYDCAPCSKRQEIANYLSTFDGIFVRENSGVEILKNEYGIAGKYVLDPVFLPELDVYSTLMNKYAWTDECKRNLLDDRYIAAYILDPTDEKRQMLLDVSHYYGNIQIIVLLDGNGDFEENQRLINLPNCIANLNVEEWLKYIKESELVITDSFHGASMSIVFEKEFYVIKNKKRGLSRFETINDILGTSERVVASPKDVINGVLKNNKLDYGKISERLNKKKEECMGWLSESLLGFKKSEEQLVSQNVIGKPHIESDDYYNFLGHKNDDFIIFGAGRFGNDAYRTITQNGLSLIGFSDNNRELWGKNHLGVQVIPPNELILHEGNICILIAMQSGREEVRKQLLDLGISEDKVFDYSFDLDYALFREKKTVNKNVPECHVPSAEEDYCMGCGACVSICSRQAISLKPDAYGYYKPIIQEDKCINCGACNKVCPARNNSISVKYSNPKLYAFYNANPVELKDSSSGGLFRLLAESVIKENGIVFGSAWASDVEGAPDDLWDNGLYAIHTSINNLSDIPKLSKSKYMQSYIGDVFRKVKSNLELGKKVLFSGCPCQVSGLYTFLGKDYECLYTLDLLCGNAPSAGFFQKYLIETFGDGIDKYTFRYKEKRWDSSTVKVVYKDQSEQIIHGSAEDNYQRVYHDHTMCPVHCQNCKYQSLPRWGDITIGDFWGFDRKDPQNQNQMGVSALLINDDKGKKIINMIPKEKVGLMKEVPLQWLGGNGYALPGNKNYCSDYRDKFYKAINYMSFSEAIEYALYS